MKFVLTGIDPTNPQTWQNGGGRALIYLHSLLHYIGENCEINAPVEPDDIVVYPDCVQGNPCNAAKVLRYMLFFWPGARIAASDCVIVYHEAYFDQVAQRYDRELPVENIVCLPTIEPGLFVNDVKSVESVIYTGKMTEPSIPMMRDLQIVGKDTMSRRDFAKLLSKTKRLYSMDHHTIVLTEAALCGCGPYLVKTIDGNHYFEPVEIKDPEACVMDIHRDAPLARKFVEIAKGFFK